jgi:ABC-type phosphate/phosphonate transport system substrate-binding protein
VLSKLFRQLEGSLGWEANAITGAYYPDAEEGLAAIQKLSPGFAVVSHQMYFDHRREMKMQVIASMELQEGALSRYHVVAKRDGGPAKVADLAGRSLASPFLKEIRFVERVLLGGGLALGPGDGQVHPVHVRQPLAALRKVARGEADAALIDEPVLAQLPSLPFGAELHAIHASEKLPPLPVVAFGTAAAADRTAMSKAILTLCAGAEGPALCKTLRVAAVEPATDRTYAGLQKQLGIR